ncbi:serine hydrolase [Paenibacillus sp. LHD-117]|uniref:serine hydrolase domain-containing protein n=1 Tax=Paenibacillus sp. LHD-117 TaxID=3071412 RepID=UPI0027E10137|nr:serine hydrolase [Paenibacillus sp. LHD-117]MDQ6421511.1 serine hydrolase [Paenibacillus sp. LHD-117]
MARFSPASPPSRTQRLDAYFRKLNDRRNKKKSGPVPDLQVLIRSERLGLEYRYSSANPPRPYHIASIGKLFTAVLTIMLAEHGRLKLEDAIADYFEPAELDRVFLHERTDYSRKVTIEQLLTHRSGIADYFGDPVADGPYFYQEIIAKPDRLWTPELLLDFTRTKQKAVAPPNGKFHYSDTGYVLLGLLLERATGESFGANLRRHIFEPLAMKDSYLLFHTKPAREPAAELAPIWFQGTEISKYRSLSCDWAGGGIVSTCEDLLAFGCALREGKLIRPEALQAMEACDQRFRPGLYYGQGMMETRFEQFFFLLRGLPRLKGHIGVLSTHFFYDPNTDTHIIMNFGSDADMVPSFKALIRIVNELRNYKKIP